jgi:rhodanese-related sulfurtransferase
MKAQSQNSPESRCVSVQTLLSSDPTTLYLIDVRDADEFTAGHVEGATNMPMMELPELKKTIPRDRIPVTICGKGGGRSESAASLLVSMGWTEAVSLCGGTNAWLVG